MVSNARRLCLPLLLGLGMAMQPAAAAYPEKPIRFVVPAAAGGGADTAVRIVTDSLTARIGQPIVIDYKPGAAGTLGLDAIAKAAPDGYTVGLASLSALTIASRVSKHVPYDPEKAFTPIAMLITQPYLLGVSSKLQVKSFADLVAYGKAHPNGLFYGSSGNGSALHVVMEMLRSSAGFPATHVPYKSITAAQTDLMAGEIQLMVDNFSTMASSAAGGRVNALAITGQKRSAVLPNVPTVAELGIPGAQAEAWAGVVGPAGMQTEAVNKLNAAINAVLAEPQVRQRFAEISSDPAPMTVTQFAQYVKAQDAKWGAVIKRANIAAD